MILLVLSMGHPSSVVFAQLLENMMKCCTHRLPGNVTQMPTLTRERDEVR